MEKLSIPTARDLPTGTLGRMADGLLNLIYPDNCITCSCPISRLRERGVCASCWRNVQLLRLSRPWCACCGIPFQCADSVAEHLCGKCCVEMPSFSGARSFGYYRNELSRIIQEFKFHDRRNLAGLLGALLVGTFLDAWKQTEVDLIVPVPLHPARKRERGFNQSTLLARALARGVVLHCSDTVLSRVRPTPPQIGLSDAARVQNVQNAFKCLRPDLVKGRSILLVDDVMTTGATLESASLALLNAGAGRVSVLTVARAVPGIE